MSSPTYSSYLQAEDWSRIVVTVSGQLLAFTGFVIILTLDMPAALRALGCIAWWLWTYLEMDRIERGFANCRAIRVNSDRSLEVLNSEMECIPSRLLGGSMVLPNMAWIRYETGSGSRAAEFFIGDCRSSNEWRRLQVIWRHVGAGH